MSQFNPDFWEIATDSEFIEGVASENALWFETEDDRERRYALQDFFRGVLPAVQDIIQVRLTDRQRQIINLYFFQNKTQEDIAEILDLTQSTVSRHLFGTVRNGKRVGGAIPKLRKAVEEECNAAIDTALQQLQERFAQSPRV